MQKLHFGLVFPIRSKVVVFYYSRKHQTPQDNFIVFHLTSKFSHQESLVRLISEKILNYDEKKENLSASSENLNWLSIYFSPLNGIPPFSVSPLSPLPLPVGRL